VVQSERTTPMKAILVSISFSALAIYALVFGSLLSDHSEEWRLILGSFVLGIGTCFALGVLTIISTLSSESK
jgi:hypothetical protein